MHPNSGGTLVSPGGKDALLHQLEEGDNELEASWAKEQRLGTSSSGNRMWASRYPISGEVPNTDTFIKGNPGIILHILVKSISFVSCLLLLIKRSVIIATSSSNYRPSTKSQTLLKHIGQTSGKKSHEAQKFPKVSHMLITSGITWQTRYTGLWSINLSSYWNDTATK